MGTSLPYEILCSEEKLFGKVNFTQYDKGASDSKTRRNFLQGDTTSRTTAPATKTHTSRPSSRTQPTFTTTTART